MIDYRLQRYKEIMRKNKELIIKRMDYYIKVR